MAVSRNLRFGRCHYRLAFIGRGGACPQLSRMAWMDGGGCYRIGIYGLDFYFSWKMESLQISVLCQYRFVGHSIEHHRSSRRSNDAWAGLPDRVCTPDHQAMVGI